MFRSTNLPPYTIKTLPAVIRPNLPGKNFARQLGASFELKNLEAHPRLLTRPLGVHRPPKCGENSGIDVRSLAQRREDFVNYEKHLEKRNRLFEFCNPENSLSQLTGVCGQSERNFYIIFPGLLTYVQSLQG